MNSDSSYTNYYYSSNVLVPGKTMDSAFGGHGPLTPTLKKTLGAKSNPDVQADNRFLPNAFRREPRMPTSFLIFLVLTKNL